MATFSYGTSRLGGIMYVAFVGQSISGGMNAFADVVNNEKMVEACLAFCGIANKPLATKQITTSTYSIATTDTEVLFKYTVATTITKLRTNNIPAFFMLDETVGTPVAITIKGTDGTTTLYSGTPQAGEVLMSVHNNITSVGKMFNGNLMPVGFIEEKPKVTVSKDNEVKTSVTDLTVSEKIGVEFIALSNYDTFNARKIEQNATDGMYSVWLIPICDNSVANQCIVPSEIYVLSGVDPAKFNIEITGNDVVKMACNATIQTGLTILPPATILTLFNGLGSANTSIQSYLKSSTRINI